MIPDDAAPRFVAALVSAEEPEPVCECGCIYQKHRDGGACCACGWTLCPEYLPDPGPRPELPEDEY